MKFWYSKDKENIEKYKYLIMMDLNLKELELLSKKDKLVNKYMNNLEKLNEDVAFREYMTKEEDARKCYNSDIRIAKKETSIEVAKKMLMKDKPIEEIAEFTELSIEEVQKLKEDL